MGSLAPAADESHTAVLRVESARALHAAESGAIIAAKLILEELELPEEGSVLPVGQGEVEFIALPPGGQSGLIVVEGRAGLGKRRISVEIE